MPDNCPTYSAEDIVERTMAYLAAQVADLERERPLLEGRLAALQQTLTHMRYMRDHRES